MKEEKIELSQEQIMFLKKFIIQYDHIDIEEWLEQGWYNEDYEKESMERFYKNYPELMLVMSPYLMFRLQKFYNTEFWCANWCGCASLSDIYDLALEYLEEEKDFWEE